MLFCTFATTIAKGSLQVKPSLKITKFNQTIKTDSTFIFNILK